MQRQQQSDHVLPAHLSRLPDNFAVPANFNTLTAQARYIPRNNPTGYVQSWHLSVQRELSKDVVLDLAYVGSRGVHLMIFVDANQAAPNFSRNRFLLPGFPGRSRRSQVDAPRIGRVISARRLTLAFRCAPTYA